MGHDCRMVQRAYKRECIYIDKSYIFTLKSTVLFIIQQELGNLQWISKKGPTKRFMKHKENGNPT